MNMAEFQNNDFVLEDVCLSVYYYETYAFTMYQIGPQAIVSFYAMGLLDTIINSESVHVSCINSHF